MDIEQTPRLRQDAQASALVAMRDDLVRDVIGGATASGVWDLTADERGRPILVLRVRDWFQGQCSGTFAREELNNEAHFSSRLNRLKGALLQVGHWRGVLGLLFADIRSWCRSLPDAYLQEEPFIIREQQSGEYEATRLAITSRGQTMWVEPIASWVVGADGRVDLRGIGGPFVLLYFQTDGGWFYLRSSVPTATLPLTEDLFLQLAEACLHG